MFSRDTGIDLIKQPNAHYAEAVFWSNDDMFNTDVESYFNESKKSNPWAICTNSVGRENKKKYERCIMSVKKKTNYKESVDPVQQIAEMLTDDPDVMVGDFDDEQSNDVGTLTAEPPIAEPVAEPAQDLDVNEFDAALDRILADMGGPTGGPTTKPVEPETMPDVDPGAPGAPTEPSEPDPFTPTRPAVMPEPKARTNRY